MKTTEQKPVINARMSKELNKVDPEKLSRKKLERINKLIKGVALPKLHHEK
jgi:hypothetical protein